jgi:hypothetical protein
MSYGIDMGWRSSKFSTKRGEEIVALRTRKVDVNVDSLLCELELLKRVR